MTEQIISIKNDVTVIGLGPVGLLAALAACNTGHSVVAVTDRSFYSRESVIECPYKAVTSVHKQLNEVLNDDQKNIHVMTQDIENSLYRRLLEFEGKNLKIIKIDKQLNDNSVYLDVKDKTLKVIDDSGITFHVKSKYFVGSDGSRHGIANQVNQQVREHNKINYIKLQKQQLHPYHALVIFQISNDQEKEFEQFLVNKRSTPYDVSFLRENFGWELKSHPEAKVFTHSGVLSVGTEIPKKIFELEDKQERTEVLNQWARIVAANYMPRDLADALTAPVYHSSEKARKQESMQVSVFEIELDEADRFIIHLGEKKSSEYDAYFMQFGDALKKPHYHTASGVSNGVYEVEQFMRFLKTNQTSQDLLELEKSVSEILSNNRTMINDYLDLRKQKEMLANYN